MSSEADAAKVQVANNEEGGDIDNILDHALSSKDDAPELTQQNNENDDKTHTKNETDNDMENISEQVLELTVSNESNKNDEPKGNNEPKENIESKEDNPKPTPTQDLQKENKPLAVKNKGNEGNEALPPLADIAKTIANADIGLIKSGSLEKQHTVEDSSSSEHIHQGQTLMDATTEIMELATPHTPITPMTPNSPVTPGSPDGPYARVNTTTDYHLGTDGEDKLGTPRHPIDGRSSTIRQALSIGAADEFLDGDDLLKLGYTAGEVKFLKNVIKCCRAENGFDLYQLMAFDGNYSTRNGCKDWMKYFFNIIKCMLCMLTQVLGIMIIMVDFVIEGLQIKEWCNPTEPPEDGDWLSVAYESYLKILAFLFSSFLAYLSIDTLTGVEQGMYKKMKYAVGIKWVNTTWLRIGLSINIFVAIIAVYGAFVVIFFSDNSLDMVLNSVALFFIVELDDLLVKQSDYERIYHYILEYQHEVQEAVEGSGCCFHCKRCFSCICHGLVRGCAWLYTLPFTLVRYFTILACFVLPFYLGYCF